MRKRPLLFLFAAFVFLGTSHSQQSTDLRKIVSKVSPNYPEIAKRMNLTGTVKVMATIAPNGNVKSVQPVGGSPVLLQAAQDAVYKWRFAPATAESKEIIELHFDPQ